VLLIGPHYGRAETVRLGYNGVVRHHKPFSLNADTIMALLCVPVDVLHTDTVGKSAARPVSAYLNPDGCWRAALGPAQSGPSSDPVRALDSNSSNIDSVVALASEAIRYADQKK